MNSTKFSDFVRNCVNAMMLLCACLGFLVFAGWALVDMSKSFFAIVGACS